MTELKSIQTSLNNKIKATSNKIRKYDEKFKAKTQNKLFIENPQKFYRSIGTKQIDVKSPPNQYEIERFWKSLFIKTPYRIITKQDGYMNPIETS